MIDFSKEDLTDKEFEAVIASRGFQKMLLYQRLSDGIGAIQRHDHLYKTMVQTITDHHSEIDSVDAVNEVLSLLEREVAMYTEPLIPDDDDESQLSDDATFSYDDRTVPPNTTVGADPEETVKDFLGDQLKERDEIKMKASEIASAVGLKSTHVGGILGRWRHAEDAPFNVSALEDSSGVNTWIIARAV